MIWKKKFNFHHYQKIRAIGYISDNYFFDHRSWESLNAYISELCFCAKSNIRQFTVPPTKSCMHIITRKVETARRPKDYTSNLNPPPNQATQCKATGSGPQCKATGSGPSYELWGTPIILGPTDNWPGGVLTPNFGRYVPRQSEKLARAPGRAWKWGAPERAWAVLSLKMGGSGTSLSRFELENGGLRNELDPFLAWIWDSPELPGCVWLSRGAENGTLRNCQDASG